MASNSFAQPLPDPVVPVPSDPEQLIAAYFNSAVVGVAVLDTELRYISVNRVLAEMNGLSVEAHLGKSIHDVIGAVADHIVPFLRTVLSKGEPVLNEEISGYVPWRQATGHWICHYFPIRDQAGAITRAAVAVIEITQQKEQQRVLLELSETLKDQVRRLQIVNDVTGLLASDADVHKVFPMISARIRRVLLQEFACFALHDAATGTLVHQVMDFPMSRGFLAGVSISRDCPASYVLSKGAPQIFAREEIAQFQGQTAEGILAEGLKSLCCLPMLRPKGPLGVLVLGSTRKDAFRTEDLNVLEKVASQLAIAIENHRAASELDALKLRIVEERSYLTGERPEGLFPEILGESSGLRQVLDQVATVAPSGANVLVLGETGTGKELVAQAIHRMSRRREGPFIKVNCAAIPTGLLESELFGHEKGAFTGAVSQKVGRIELAHRGTLLLDEVGEISPELQPKLLRVLQDQEFERLGSNHTVKVDVRLIAATNRDLAQEVEQHRFRSDLFYRLSVFPIHVPPLRERRADIPVLVREFVNKFSARMQRRIEIIPKETMDALCQWAWPGNVRELENLMERSVILSAGPVLRVPLAELRQHTLSVPEVHDHTLDNAERQHILRVLRDTRGVLSGPNGAARRLGLKRTTLQSKMKRLGITPKDYSGSQD